MKYKLLTLPRRNPAVSRDDWPRTWRSHAVFASGFPVLEASLDYLRFCSRIDPPILDGEPVDLPDLSRDYDGAAVAASDDPGTFDGSCLSAGARAQIETDETRVFADNSPRFSFHCKETLVAGGEPGDAAVFCMLARAGGTGVDAFMLRWHREHAALVQLLLGQPGGIVRYAHNRLHVPPPTGFPFDGIGEYWFASEEDAVRAVAGGIFAPLRDDLARFCDMERSVVMLTSVCHAWPEPFVRG